MVPVMKKTLHTYLLSDDSKLNNILGTWNSEMNKTVSTLQEFLI